MTQTHQITELLQSWSRGNSQALSKLIPLVDHELKKIANKYMRNERAGHVLQPTALVNEAVMRLIGAKQITWQSRKHFYALVAKRMRQVLIDYARRRRAEPIHITDAMLPYELAEELLLLEQALTKLAKIDERKASIVECRHFGGFTVKEVAKLLDISTATVEREWRFARSWLKQEMTAASLNPEPPRSHSKQLFPNDSDN